MRHSCRAVLAAIAYVVAVCALAWPVALLAQRADTTLDAPPRSGERSSADEIIVTARRREERVRDVPVALSVIAAEQMEFQGHTLEQVQQLVPTLHVFGFNPRATSVSIRGLGGSGGLTNDGLENGVGIFVDEVYLGRVGSSMFELIDLERIEVLRGPQGTLFGKNTTAGAINIVTQRPSFDEAQTNVAGSLGGYRFHQAKASISAPLGEKIAGRISVADTHRDGYIDNLSTGERLQDFDNFTARGQLLIAPASDLEIRLISDYARQKLDCCVNVAAGLFEQLDNGAPVPDNYLARTARLGYLPPPFAPFDRQVDVDAPVAAEMAQRGLSAQVTRPFKALELTSITAYREWDWDPANDADETGLPVVDVARQPSRQKQVSQELRIASRGDHSVDYVAGVYYFDQTVDGQGFFTYGPLAYEWYFPPTTPLSRQVREAALSGFGTESKTSSELRSASLFGQGTWHATAALDFTVGLRFTHEERWGGFEQIQTGGASLLALAPASAAAAQSVRDSFGSANAYEAEVDDDGVSGTANLSYRLGPRALTYAMYSRGAKSAGLNLANLPPTIDPVVRPEEVHHYEIGAKTVFDRGVTLDVAIYRTTLFDYQTSVLDPSGAGGRLVNYISNVEEARSKGIEVDARWAIGDRFALSANVAYADGVYVHHPNGPCPIEVSLTPMRCDLSGRPLGGAPKRASALALDVVQPLSRGRALHARLGYNRQSDVLTGLGASRYSRVEGFGLVSLNVGVRMIERGWDVALWARNLMDEDYYQMLAGRTSGLINGVTGEPRTVGVTFSGVF
jgi:iron complex outermembrane receptor protein